MNRNEFVRRVTSVMRENDIRKPVSSPKQVFHISDDEGNSKDFVVRKTDKKVIFTIDDVEAVVDACLSVIADSLKRGEEISFRGFGSLGLKYRKPRATKKPGSEEWVEVTARYIPKFNFGNDLRMAAKMYELSLQDGGTIEPPDLYDRDIDDPDEDDYGELDGE